MQAHGQMDVQAITIMPGAVDGDIGAGGVGNCLIMTVDADGDGGNIGWHLLGIQNGWVRGQVQHQG